MKHVRVLIIGGGPAGLTAAIYCGRAGLNPLVASGGIDGGLMPGGQLMITTEVENYPGFPDGVTGPELMENFTKQAKRFGATLVDEWVTSVDTSEKPFKVTLGEEQIVSDSIIIATGATAKWLNLPDEDIFKNNGISACATCDGPLPCFRKKHLHVVGGGDTAMEEALFLTKFASQVTILYRGPEEKLRASKVMKERAMQNPKINFKFHAVIEKYVGSKETGLTGFTIRNTLDSSTYHEDSGGLFMGIGHQPSTGFLKGTDINLTENGYIESRDNIHTNVDGIFTCGDVHDQHYRQAVTASGFGCMAAIEAERWLK